MRYICFAYQNQHNSTFQNNYVLMFCISFSYIYSSLDYDFDEMITGIINKSRERKTKNDLTSFYLMRIINEE